MAVTPPASVSAPIRGADVGAESSSITANLENEPAGGDALYISDMVKV